MPRFPFPSVKPAEVLGALREYLGTRNWRRREPIDGRAGLVRFVQTRTSYVAQTSLYGYLRTRAGMRYPELFGSDAFVVSLDIAKWHVWLACLGDLSVYSGGMLLRAPRATPSLVADLMTGLVDHVLDEQGLPAGAGEEYPAHAARVRQRLRGCAWTEVTDDEGPFQESPRALVQWAPIVDELKQHDEAIVINSVRFRWQEVRRELRATLDAAAVLDDRG